MTPSEFRQAVNTTASQMRDDACRRFLERYHATGGKLVIEPSPEAEHGGRTGNVIGFASDPSFWVFCEDLADLRRRQRAGLVS